MSIEHLTAVAGVGYASTPVPPKGRRPSPDRHVWAEARSRYLDGFSARQVCAELDICLSSFRARAAREGWRRFDQPSPAWPKDWTADHEEELPDAAIDLYAHAWRHACRAVVRGDRHEARTWLKLSRELQDLGREQEERQLSFTGMLADKVAETEERLAALGADPAAVPPAWPDDGRYDFTEPLPADEHLARLAALTAALQAAEAEADSSDSSDAKSSLLPGGEKEGPATAQPTREDEGPQQSSTGDPDASDSSDSFSPESEPAPPAPEPAPEPEPEPERKLADWAIRYGRIGEAAAAHVAAKAAARAAAAQARNSRPPSP